MMGKIGFICETCGNVASNRQHKASNRQHKAGGLHIGIYSLLEYKITQNASKYRKNKYSMRKYRKYKNRTDQIKEEHLCDGQT